jgi:peptide/nickel transport system substrate-binding protein
MLTIALDRVDFLPANRVTDNAAILTLKHLVFEPLCRWQDGAVLPALFGAWSHDGTARQWHFTLRDDARFHDGAPCTGEDIVAFLAAILDSRDMFGMRWSYARYFEGTVMQATAQGVGFDCPAPFGDLPEVLSEFYIARNDGAGRPLLGTGPYRVRAFSAGQAVLEPHRPDLPTLTFRAIPRAEDRLEALLAGRIDAAAGLEQADHPPRQGEELHWLSAVNTLSVMAYLNSAQGVFTHPAARLAANLAVDRARLIEEVYAGQAVAASSIVSPWHTGFAQGDLAPIPHDPDRARRLLDTVVGPRDILLRTPDHMPERAPAITACIARDLAAVGFAPRIEMEHDRPLYARQIANKQMGDVALFDSSPHVTFRVMDDKISARSRALWWQGYEDEQADTLFTAARAAPETDRRARLYGRTLARLQDNPPWLYLVHPVALAARRHGTPPLFLDAKGVLSPLPRKVA